MTEHEDSNCLINGLDTVWIVNVSEFIEVFVFWTFLYVSSKVKQLRYNYIALRIQFATPDLHLCY